MEPMTPYIKDLGATFVVRRLVDGRVEQYWNERQKRWLDWKEVHGPSAQNPKASYFRSREKAQAAIDRMQAAPSPKHES